MTVWDIHGKEDISEQEASDMYDLFTRTMTYPAKGSCLLESDVAVQANIGCDCGESSGTE
jgi:hypothetical protein